MSTQQCPGCHHDADLDAVLRSGYSEFADHLDTCTVLTRHRAKVASDERDRRGVLGRAKQGEKVFFCPEPDAYAQALTFTDMMRGVR